MPVGAAAQSGGSAEASASEAKGAASEKNDTPKKGDVTEIENTVPEAAFKDARSRETLIVQALLDRTAHSPGVIDGFDGGNTQRAVRAFEKANGLTVDGRLDAKLIQTLADQVGEGVLRTYTLTTDDVSGPFKPVPDSMAEMAKRDNLGFAGVEELLGEKFHMTPGLLKALNPDADMTREGTKILVVENGEGAVPGKVLRIEVDKANSELRAFGEDDQLIASFPATVGSSEFPSPTGTMQIAAMDPEPNYTFDPDDQEWGSDETLILPPGPNNPVGGTWIDLGKEGYGIHGSPEPSNIGKTASHGCVRLTNWDAEALANAVEPGKTEVVFM